MPRKMKDSGVEWIGEVPEKWSLLTGKKCAFEVVRRNENLEEKTALRFSYGTIIPKSNFDPDNEKFVRDTLSKYTIVSPGDLVLNGLNLNFDFITKRVGLVKQAGAITSSYLVIKPYSFINPIYLCYLLKSYDEMTVFHNMGTGVRKTIKYSDFKYLPIIIPPKKEQDLIALYLDLKCNQIDEQINNQEKLIEELEDYKKSLITEAVTKGLDPNAEMKESGVEWIGEISKSFHLSKVKYFGDEEHSYAIGDGDHGLVKNDDYKDSGIPYLRVSNLTWGNGLDLSELVYISDETNNKIKSSQLRPGDVLIAKTGATIGKTAIVPDNIPISNTTSHVGKITVSKDQNNKYLYYCLNSKFIKTQIDYIATLQSTRPELGIEGLKNLVLPMPSLEEQTAIVSYLDHKCSQIDHQIKKRKELIEKLKEYKSSLIYEVVTGKREVPAIETEHE